MYMLTAVLLLVWAFVNMVSNTIDFMGAEESGKKISLALAMFVSGAIPLAIAILLFVIATKNEKGGGSTKANSDG